MKTTKKGPRVGGLSLQASEQNAADLVRAFHSNVASILEEMKRLNAPADKVEANWMARGSVQSFEVMAGTMVLLVHSLKPIPYESYRYWTRDPRLQLQLFSAYLRGFVVDFFSMAPEGPPFRSLKDGGEILTINIDQ